MSKSSISIQHTSLPIFTALHVLNQLGLKRWVFVSRGGQYQTTTDQCGHITGLTSVDNLVFCLEIVKSFNNLRQMKGTDNSALALERQLLVATRVRKELQSCTQQFHAAAVQYRFQQQSSLPKRSLIKHSFEKRPVSEKSTHFIIIIIQPISSMTMDNLGLFCTTKSLILVALYYSTHSYSNFADNLLWYRTRDGLQESIQASAHTLHKHPHLVLGGGRFN